MKSFTEAFASNVKRTIVQESITEICHCGVFFSPPCKTVILPIRKILFIPQLY